MSDTEPHKVKTKNLAELKAELQVADSREQLNIARERAQSTKQKEWDTLPKLQKHENYKGSPLLRHKDYNHQHQPSGAMLK
jgi:hypothetical protein